jgi:ketosteroid isomerase-like protein
MLALLSPDVVYLRAGVPAVYGRDGARALFAASSALVSQSVTWQPLGGGVSYDLRSAYTYGVTARVAPSRAAVKLERYLAFWEREQGSRWRIAVYAEVGPLTAGEASVSGESSAPPVTRGSKRTLEAAAQLRAADSLFSDLTDRMGMSFAFSNTVDAEGVVFGKPTLVIGPKAIEDFYATEAAGTALTWRPVYVAVAASLDLGFTVGEYSSTSRGPSGAAIQRFGKYLTVWRRQSDGTWKFVAHAANSTPGTER